MPGLVRIETHPGQPVMTGGVRLLPFAQCLTLRLPAVNFGLVWNRPVSVLVTGTDGQEQVLLVPDPTRQIVWSLYAAAGILAIFTVLSNLMRKANNERQ